MDWIQDQLCHAPTPNTIIHLGAGLCRELQHYIDSGAARIILVEPNPELLPELQKHAAAHSNVQILPVAIAAEPGKSTLKLYNYPDLSSLRRPTGLTELLPGLQQIDQAIVNVIAAHTLPEHLGLKNDENNWLVIDTPGEEETIISNLQQHKQLSHFDRVILRGGTERLYDGMPTVDQLTRQLENLGYYIEGAKDSSDPDWPRYHLRLNPKAIEVRRLRREIETLTEQKDVLEKKLEEGEEQKRNLYSQVEKLQDKLEELEDFRRTAEQNPVLEQQKRELADQIQQREQQLQAENDALRKELDSIRDEVQQQRSDISVALRLQNLRENDLKDLQQRYGQLMQTNQDQKELLGKLHRRLSVAADYLRLMNEQQDDRGELQEGLVRALIGNDSETT